MNKLKELKDYIREFNKTYVDNFEIDSIRIEFEKQHKQAHLKSLGCWNKLKKNSNILSKLKKRQESSNVISVYQLEKYNIYYWIKKDDTNKYRKCEMVIFGLKQYHKDPPPCQIVEYIYYILTRGTSKTAVNIDVCLDISYKPNYEALRVRYLLTDCWYQGNYTNTKYINDTGLDCIEKIVFYDKQYKNSLGFVCWRIEAKIIIPNIKYLALPLHEFNEIIEIAKVITRE
jgi:hypothetical protein